MFGVRYGASMEFEEETKGKEGGMHLTNGYLQSGSTERGDTCWMVCGKSPDGKEVRFGFEVPEGADPEDCARDAVENAGHTIEFETDGPAKVGL